MGSNKNIITCSMPDIFIDTMQYYIDSGVYAFRSEFLRATIRDYILKDPFATDMMKEAIRNAVVKIPRKKITPLGRHFDKKETVQISGFIS